MTSNPVTLAVLSSGALVDVTAPRVLAADAELRCRELAGDQLAFGSTVQVDSGMTSAAVAAVLVCAAGGTYVGVGALHAGGEHYAAVAPREVLPLAELRSHWNSLRLRRSADGVFRQEGALPATLSVDDLLEACRSSASDGTDDLAVFLPSVAGFSEGRRTARAYTCELTMPSGKVLLRHSYLVRTQSRSASLLTQQVA